MFDNREKQTRQSMPPHQSLRLRGLRTSEIVCIILCILPYGSGSVLEVLSPRNSTSDFFGETLKPETVFITFKKCTKMREIKKMGQTRLRYKCIENFRLFPTPFDPQSPLLYFAMVSLK